LKRHTLKAKDVETPGLSGSDERTADQEATVGVEGTRSAANVSTGIGRGAGSPRVRACAALRECVAEAIAGLSGRIFSGRAS